MGVQLNQNDSENIRKSYDIANISYPFDKPYVRNKSSCSEYINNLLRIKLSENAHTGGSDIFAANNGVLHEGGSLTTVGGNIKGVGASCHIVYRSIALSQFIDHKQSNHSITA